MQDTQQHSIAPTPIDMVQRALNGRWHKAALLVFMVIVFGHLAEHLVQAIQIFVLGWPRPQSLGILGLFYPWLIKSETLHYGYAIVMLIGLYLLRPGFAGRALTWWTIALAIQFWHHIEHALLIGQAIAGRNLFGSPVPTSILQLFFPRVELHLAYNIIVLIPMLVAVYFHRYAPGSSAHVATCTCALPGRIPALDMAA